MEILLKEINFIDLCAGIGGFHYALNKLGLNCVFASEINKDCKEVYFNNYNMMPHGNIIELEVKNIPEHSILCAGFPCQPFSIAGKQNGFDDHRGNIFFEILKIIKAKNPDTIFLENVKNLLNHSKGETLKTILSLLEKENYYVSYSVLNSKDFNSAQNRERIFIVGNKLKKFDFSKIIKGNTKNLIDVINLNNNNYIDQDAYTIIEKNKWVRQKSGLIFCGYINKNTRIRNKVNLNSSSNHRQQNRIYHIDGTHPTINSQEIGGRYFIYDNIGVRKLTIDECYKLMGFPECFIKSKTISNQYKQIGNSVCVNLIYSISKEILKQLY